MEDDVEQDMEKIFGFLHEIENLKNTLRWNKTSSGRQESTAEHSWRLAVMTMIVAKELKLDLDVNHAVRIALTHDLAEAITGDIDYGVIVRGRLSKTQKGELEFKAMNKLKNYLPEHLRPEIFGLWQEYEKCETEEAKFVKALDKLETTLQQIDMNLLNYVDEDIDGYGLIATYPNKAMQYYPKLKPLVKIIKQRLKSKYIKDNIPWKEEYDKI